MRSYPVVELRNLDGDIGSTLTQQVIKGTTTNGSILPSHYNTTYNLKPEILHVHYDRRITLSITHMVRIKTARQHRVRSNVRRGLFCYIYKVKRDGG